MAPLRWTPGPRDLPPPRAIGNGPAALDAGAPGYATGNGAGYATGNGAAVLDAGTPGHAAGNGHVALVAAAPGYATGTVPAAPGAGTPGHAAGGAGGAEGSSHSNARTSGAPDTTAGTGAACAGSAV